MATFLFEPTPNEEAVAFLKNKAVVARGVFNKMLPELKARAFTIAGVTRLETLQNVRDTLAELPAGGDWRTLKKSIIGEISPYFVDSDDPEERAAQMNAADRRAELLLRIHGQVAYAAAGERLDDEMSDLFPYRRYQTRGDGHVRSTHAALNGITLPFDSPFWATHTPPWEWACRCIKIKISDSDAADIRKADAQRAPEARELIEGADLERLEKQNVLVRHLDPINKKGAPTPFNVQSPWEAGKPGAFHWNPKDLRLSLDDLRKRYDPDLFAGFEVWARGVQIAELGLTLWEWLEGSAAAGDETAPGGS
jgi:hypothetical protein